ncbi:MAG: hypothetical protein RMZ41_019245 [Nostoc sp. DedVER02]|uniref:hypothetical protein n=1 Tax=unclassified Nostoc TaxID=2593658 RepID=UPI002AD3117A|nr:MULTISPECIES: hypothetical protein [unclassified Nostoc]MDZ7988943.1 hypothetical protein [Nostoc sp. DedVER02]MDZ8114737.1 hypothetical protein [Nostoc sp. DedVER01b]
MAKLESGKMILNLEKIHLSRLVNTSISDMQAIAGQKMIPDLPELELSRLRRHLLNCMLLSVKRSRILMKSFMPN